LRQTSELKLLKFLLKKKTKEAHKRRRRNTTRTTKTICADTDWFVPRSSS
jgi:hypothetical protein